jgi:glycosyltransferase involved in cell wall biosynthesis
MQGEHKYIARPRTGTLEEVLERPLPGSKDEAVQNLSMLDFVSLINCFDLYVDPASAHGFNLPAAEAAVCGVPVATVDDSFARSEIYGSCAYMMKPSASDYWHTGAALPMVSPRRIEETIVAMWDDSELRKSTAENCKNFFDTVKWQPAADLFAKKFISTHEFCREMLGE